MSDVRRGTDSSSASRRARQKSPTVSISNYSTNNNSIAATTTTTTTTTAGSDSNSLRRTIRHLPRAYERDGKVSRQQYSSPSGTTTIPAAAASSSGVGASVRSIESPALNDSMNGMLRTPNNGKVRTPWAIHTSPSVLSRTSLSGGGGPHRSHSITSSGSKPSNRSSESPSLLYSSSARGNSAPPPPPPPPPPLQSTATKIAASSYQMNGSAQKTPTSLRRYVGSETDKLMVELSEARDQMSRLIELNHVLEKQKLELAHSRDVEHDHLDRLNRENLQLKNEKRQLQVKTERLEADLAVTASMSEQLRRLQEEHAELLRGVDKPGNQQPSTGQVLSTPLIRMSTAEYTGSVPLLGATNNNASTPASADVETEMIVKTPETTTSSDMAGEETVPKKRTLFIPSTAAMQSRMGTKREPGNASDIQAIAVMMEDETERKELELLDSLCGTGDDSPNTQAAKAAMRQLLTTIKVLRDAQMVSRENGEALKAATELVTRQRVSLVDARKRIAKLERVLGTTSVDKSTSGGGHHSGTDGEDNYSDTASHS